MQFSDYTNLKLENGGLGYLKELISDIGVREFGMI
jgi:hypothetical protein